MRCSSSTTIAPRASSWTPARSGPSPSVFGRRLLAIRISSTRTSKVPPTVPPLDHEHAATQVARPDRRCKSGASRAGDGQVIAVADMDDPARLLPWEGVIPVDQPVRDACLELPARQRRGLLEGPLNDGGKSLQRRRVLPRAWSARPAGRRRPSSDTDHPNDAPRSTHVREVTISVHDLWHRADAVVPPTMIGWRIHCVLDDGPCAPWGSRRGCFPACLLS